MSSVTPLRPTRAFEALAHDTRLAIVRLLIPIGVQGLTAGAIGERLGLRPNALSFHLGRLTGAGLLSMRRSGRNQFYAVDYAALAGLVAFLADDCCAAAPEGCLPSCAGLSAASAGAGRAGRRPRAAAAAGGG